MDDLTTRPPSTLFPTPPWSWAESLGVTPADSSAMFWVEEVTDWTIVLVDPAGVMGSMSTEGMAAPETIASNKRWDSNIAMVCRLLITRRALKLRCPVLDRLHHTFHGLQTGHDIDEVGFI